MFLYLTDMSRVSVFFVFFFFNDTATTEIYTLSLHDALPIYKTDKHTVYQRMRPPWINEVSYKNIMEYLEYTGWIKLPLIKSDENFTFKQITRSEEHTSELQSH